MKLLAAVRGWINRRFAAKPLGVRGEAAAARYLAGQGYKILARGDRSRLGEIDLVAMDGRTVVFIEVKTRQNADEIHPSEAVDAAKQGRLTRLALAFLKRHGLLGQAARFDVVAVTWPAAERHPTIEHIQNAFEPVGKWQFYS